MIFLILFMSGVYAAFLVLIVVGSFRLPGADNTHTPRVSVLVAARNEEAVLGACLEALIEQTYARNLHEIIVINDRSTDVTGALIESFATRHAHIKVVTITQNNSEMAHKKNALTCGIAQATGELLLFTDADCIVPPSWIATTVTYFTPSIGAVAGYSYFDDGRTGALPQLTALMAHGLEVVNAGIIGLGDAFSCTGRNFAYRRSVYDEVEGFTKIGHSPSGDDDLMLQLIQQHTSWRISYAGVPPVHVRSLPPRTLSGLSGQRTRHMSAARWYPLRYKVIGAGMVGYSLLLAWASVTAGGGLISVRIVMFAWVLKFLAEVGVLLRADILFGKRLQWRWAPVLSLLFVPYFIIFPLRGLFGTFTWKGEQ